MEKVKDPADGQRTDGGSELRLLRFLSPLQLVRHEFLCGILVPQKMSGWHLSLVAVRVGTFSGDCSAEESV